LEYWKSTTKMIGDRPFFGVGPGNFQDFYTQYKLPAASEEIRDPHSWLFEIAATAGLPALLVLCVVLAAGVYRIVIAKPQEVVDDARSISDWFVYGGAATALIVAFILGPLAGLPFGIEKLLCGLAVGGTALYALRDWVRQGNLSPQMIAIAIGVMMVNLLAAGGIMYPGVAGTLWLLLALSLNLAEPRVFAPSKLVPATALGAIVVLALVQYLTGYSPVLQCQGAMLEALNVANNPQAQEQVLMFATEVDPRAAEPWQELAAMRLRAWEAQGGAGSLQDFRQASQRLLELRPHSASAHRLVGKWWLQVYEKSPTPGNADNAVVNLSRAVELYPNHPVIRSELAIALSDAGNRTAAQREAQKSMELDGATPHADKKLSVAIRQRMAQILEETPASPR
jgi:hypothetical protein